MSAATNKSNLSNSNHPIILFDGVCNLCNQYIIFIIKRTTGNPFKFGTLQSAAAQELLLKNGLDKDVLDTVIMIEGDKIYTKSDVALRISKDMNGIWSVAKIFYIFPKPFRDWIYDIVSRNRYRWFGKKESCMIPTPELKALFLE